MAMGKKKRRQQEDFLAWVATSELPPPAIPSIGFRTRLRVPGWGDRASAKGSSEPPPQLESRITPRSPEPTTDRCGYPRQSLAEADRGERPAAGPGIDATTLEANAALRSIVRRDSEQGYEEFLMELAKASGIETPRREDLAKLDRKRTGKGSNRVWKHPHDAQNEGRADAPGAQGGDRI